MTQQSQSSIPEMFNQSVAVLTNPSETTLERYERQGTVRDAAIYVAVGAAIAALLGIGGGVGGFVANFINAFAGFFIFTALVFYVGRTQGGSGTFDEVAYTFSLFWAPLAIIGGILTAVLWATFLGRPLIPLVVFLGLLINGYFGFLAVRSSMNLTDAAKSLITLGAAVLGTLVIQTLILRPLIG